MSEHCPVCEAGEKLGRLFKEFGPSEEVIGHFRQSRIEFLKGIRTMLDEHIDHLANPPQQKGTRVTVE
jgi:hypothetical protein